MIIQGCPIRAVVAVQMFFACFVTYMLRVNISMNIIAMVVPSDSSEEAPDYGPRYEWSKTVQGTILGAYFWGYIVSEIPGGFLAERYGPAKVTLISTILSGVFTLVTPFVAPVHYGMVIASRVLLGIVSGALYPALHCMISRWAPPEEKGKFTAALLGGQLGTMVTWGVLGYIIAYLGWLWAFVIPAIVSILWSILWWFTVSDAPDNHPWITEAEKKYIADALADTVNTEKKIPPFKDILLNLGFWALVILHFGNLWGLYLLLTGAPQYMSEALGYNIKNSGILASLPYLARLVFGLIFGSIGDVLVKKNALSVTAIRKIFVIFSHILPALFLYCLLLAGKDHAITISLITFSLGMNGASTLTNLQNHQDLAPNYAGTLYGMMNTIGGITGFITPAVTSAFTDVDIEIGWRNVFLLGASIYLGCAIIYLIFGTGKKQEFNEKQGFRRTPPQQN